MRLSRPLLVAALTAVILAISTSAATAHPFVTGGATAPAGSLVTIELEMGHGCGTEDDAGGEPTLEVALEVPPEMSYVAPRDTDEYAADFERGADVQAEVVVWTATGSGLPAPVLPLEVVVEGIEGDEVYLSVFQGCADFEYRWIGTPDDPADDPAVLLTLGAPDPNAPPPPEEPRTNQAAADSAENQAGESPTNDPTTSDPAPPSANDDSTATGQSAASDAEADDGAGGDNRWPSILIGGVALVAVGVAIAARRRPDSQSPPAPSDRA